MNQRKYQRDGAAAGSSALSNHRVGRRESPTSVSARGTTGHGDTVMVLAMLSSGCSKTFSKAAATISVLISQVSTASRTKGDCGEISTAFACSLCPSGSPIPGSLDLSMP